uniref:Orf25 n=1 Tax=Serratia marcescens TaxID=615 RepID=A0A7S7BTN6_SERMA|nr:Orf25 [Serratia marcescens]
MRYFSLAVYRQKNGGVLAFIMMQGESSGTFDAALNPIGWRNATLLVNKGRSRRKEAFW